MIRALRRWRLNRRKMFRSTIRPMPEGTLLGRCAALCGWVSA